MPQWRVNNHNKEIVKIVVLPHKKSPGLVNWGLKNKVMEKSTNPKSITNIQLLLGLPNYRGHFFSGQQFSRERILLIRGQPHFRHLSPSNLDRTNRPRNSQVRQIFPLSKAISSVLGSWNTTRCHAGTIVPNTYSIVNFSIIINKDYHHSKYDTFCMPDNPINQDFDQGFPWFRVLELPKTYHPCRHPSVLPTPVPA